MPGWKDKLSRLSDREARQREAAFEAATLVELTKQATAPTAAPPLATAPQPADSLEVSITVTKHGRTVTYPNLATVPPELRQRIITAWQRNQNS